MTTKVDQWVARARGPLGRVARAWLVLAGDRGDRVATDAVWDLWLDKPDPALWAALARWRRPRTGHGLSLVALGRPAEPEDVAAAACRGGHPVAVIARAVILAGQQDVVDAACAAVMSTPDKELTALCVEHHLAPADPHQAAMFFLLTGQDEQYRLVDPDHSLLALAYQGAGEDVRSRVRARAAADQDLVRALAGTVGRRPRVSGREAEYLIEAFAGRRDWAGVWKLAKDLPVIEAAAAVRRCTDWRPAGPDAALFDALAATAPTELAESRRAALEPVRLPAAGTFRGSMAPDGRRVAVSAPRLVDVFTFPDGERQERVPIALHGRMLALDDGVLIVSHTDEQPGDGFSELGYVAPAGGPGTAGTCRFHYATTFGRTPDGFAALTYDYRKHAHRLHLLSGGGRDFHHYEHRVLEVLAELGIVSDFPREMYAMATEPGSGRLVIAGGTALHFAEITSGGLRRLATASCRSGSVRRLSFSGPDRLIRLIFGGTLQVWRLDGDEPRLAVERQVDGQDVVDLPRVGVVATVLWAGNEHRVRYLDRETLDDVPAPSQFHDWGEPEHLFGSSNGDLLGVGYRDGVEVLDTTMVALADRPLAATTPADLHAVRARLDRAPTSRFLELLHACLVHRFCVDVALGDGGMINGPADDIALGGTA